MPASKIHIPKQVLVLIALAVLLSLGRVALSGSIYFLYLLWNIFLAFVPFAISLALLWFAMRKNVHPFVLIVGGLVWLVLFPNAPYIVTDVIHLKESHAVPVWYDALLLFTSAWTGMLLGLYSLSHIETILRKFFSKKITWTLLTLAILLSSFGIYVGRFLRWNSWDIIANPHNVFSDTWGILASPNTHSEGYFVTIVFFFFMILSYIAWRPNDPMETESAK